MKDNFEIRAADWDKPEKIKMTELFVAELLQKITLLPQWKALEVGAGTGLVGLQILNKVKKIVFEDTSAAMLNVLKNKKKIESKVEILHGEVFDYTLTDIDFVFSCMAFHHIPEIEKALRHIYHITKPKAIVAIADLLQEDGSFHSFEPIPHKGFDIDQLTYDFELAGFEIKSVSVYNTLNRERVKGIISTYHQFMLVAQKK